MAKDRSFAAKVAKSQHSAKKKCPVCNVEINTIHVVETPFRQDKKSWRFKDRYVGICKCNEKEFMS
jgi:phage FluMu protein Com